MTKKLTTIEKLIEKLCPDGVEFVELEARKNQYEYYREKLLTFKEK